MNLKDSLLDRINELLEKELNDAPHAAAAEVHLAVINMFQTLYGPHAPQIDMVKKVRDQIYDGEKWAIHYQPTLFLQYLHGFLRTLASDLQEGRIVNIQSEARGEVLGDFLILAREALGAGQKDVASVLACAGLEDTLKRCAGEQGLNVQDKNMSTVVKALKSARIIRGTQSALLDRFIKLRNHTFHAEWDKIKPRDVEDIARFTEEFLAYQFSSSLTANSSEDTSADA